jgi:glycine betaine/proline transport system substrate-binding protein
MGMSRYGLMKKLWGFALVSVALVAALAACGGGEEEKPTITIIDGNWTSVNVLGEVAAKVITDQLGYPTERLRTDVTPGWAALCEGDADVAVEAWLPGRLPEIQPFIDQGCVELGGTNFPGGIGWFVPAYVIEGDASRGIDPMAPGLKDITDLNEYWELFENPENPGKGEILGGDPGWIDHPDDISRIKGYELNYYRSNQGEAVIQARVKAAVLKGEPILFYLWTPHSFFGEVDTIQIGEPDPYDPAKCFLPLENGEPHTGELPYRCAHAAYDVRTVIRTEVKETAPDVANLIENMYFSEKGVSDIMYQVDVLERDVAEVVDEWIAAHQSDIDAWIAGNRTD